MLYLLKETNGSQVYYLISGKEYLVSRKSGDIIFSNDGSISRKHAILRIESDSATIKDCKSKYGTHVNDRRTEPEVETPVKTEDVIKFGVSGSIYRMEKLSIVTTGSNLSSSQKSDLKRTLDIIGGTLISNWDSSCTHLTTQQTVLSIKVLHALLDDKPIVKMEYWITFAENAKKNKPPPNIDDFKPPLAESLVDSSDMIFNPNRKNLFKHKTFIFPTEKIKSKMEEIIEKTGGTSISWDKQPMSLLHIMNSIDKYIFIQTEEDKEPPQSLLDIYQNLSKLGQRTIPVQEIALAILKCSWEKDCNPNFNRVENVFMRPETNSNSEVCRLAVETQSQEDEMESKVELLIPGSLDSNPELSSSAKVSAIAKQPLSAVNTLPSTSGSNPKRSLEDHPENVFKKIRLDNTLTISDMQSNDSKKRKAEESVGPSSKKSSIRENPFALLKNKNVTRKTADDNPFAALRIKKETNSVDDNPFIKIREAGRNSKIVEEIVIDSPRPSPNEPSTSNITKTSYEANSDFKWLSKTTCTTESVRTVEVREEFKDIFNIFKGKLVVEVLPVVQRPINTSYSVDGNLSNSTSSKNFKKFKKILPVRPQRSIITTSIPQLTNGETNEVTILSDGEEDDEMPSRPIAKKTPARRFNF